MKLADEETNGLWAVFVASAIFFIFNLIVFVAPIAAIIYNLCLFFILIARIPEKSGIMKYSLWENALYSIFFSLFPLLILFSLITIAAFLCYNGAIIFILTALMSHKRFIAPAQEIAIKPQ